MNPILNFDLSSEAYHAETECASNSNLSLLKRSPIHMKWAQANPVESPAMRLGTLVHYAVLEGDAFDLLYVSGPEGDRRKKDVRDEWAYMIEEHGAEYVLKPDEFNQIQAMRDAISSHPVASSLLLPAYGVKTEASCFWDDEYTGVRCKARLDSLPAGKNGDVICDLKTTVNGSAEEFSKKSFSFGYHRAAAHYLEAWKQCGDDDRPDFLFVVVEKNAPHGVSVFQMCEASIALGRRELDRLLQVWQMCDEDGVWAGYPTHVQQLTLPAYAFTQELL